MADCVILAAGNGTRLMPKTIDRPKAMVILCDRPIIDYVLRFASQLTQYGSCYVVGGYCIETLRRHQSQTCIPYQLLENQDYPRGSLRSLHCALSKINDSFYILNADHIFDVSAFSAIIPAAQASHITTFCDSCRTLGADDMKVRSRRIGSLSLVGRISKSLTEWDLGYVGITHVPLTRLAEYKAACAAVIASDPSVTAPELVLDQLAQKEEELYCHDIGKQRWFEIDNAEDYARAEACINMDRPCF